MTTTLASAALLPTYARADVTFVSGEGAWLVDRSGKRYLDLLGGIAVVGLGHCHPAPLAAAHAQLDSLWHTSNLYSTEPMTKLCPDEATWRAIETRQAPVVTPVTQVPT